MLRKVSVAGVELLDASSKSALLHHMLRTSGVYVSVNAEAFVSDDEEFKKIINTHQAFADGFGAVLAARLLSKVKLEKIPGCVLWTDFLAITKPSALALFGAAPEVNRRTQDLLRREFPQHEVVFASHGFVSRPEEILRAIVDSQPNVVILGLGQPRQEKIASALFESLPKAVFLPVGGGLDVYSGEQMRAPDWMIQYGLEWLFRLIKEPSRWRRQLALPRFLVWLLRNLVSLHVQRWKHAKKSR